MEGSFSLRGALHDAHAASVEAEIREEFEAHLELCADALLAEGRTDEEARREARARFGDVEKTLSACRRIQLEGRVAMQRLQWILIVILAASTLLLGWRGMALSRAVTAERDHALAQQEAALAAGAQARAMESQAREPVEHIVIGVGDELKVRSDELAVLGQSTEVQADGQALFRDIGWVKVAGRTRQEVEQELTQRYAQIYSDLGPVYVLVKAAR